MRWNNSRNNGVLAVTNEQILREALENISKLDPENTADGFNEWGKADCFEQAQSIATVALATTATSQPSNTKGQWVSDKEYWEAPTATPDSDSTDAARYRIMCKAITTEDDTFMDAMSEQLGVIDTPTEAQWDAAIDAIIAATKKESP